MWCIIEVNILNIILKINLKDIFTLCNSLKTITQNLYMIHVLLRVYTVLFVLNKIYSVN